MLFDLHGASSSPSPPTCAARVLCGSRVIFQGTSAGFCWKRGVGAGGEEPTCMGCSHSSSHCRKVSVTLCHVCLSFSFPADFCHLLLWFLVAKPCDCSDWEASVGFAKAWVLQSLCPSCPHCQRCSGAPQLQQECAVSCELKDQRAH